MSNVVWYSQHTRPDWSIRENMTYEYCDMAILPLLRNYYIIFDSILSLSLCQPICEKYKFHNYLYWERSLRFDLYNLHLMKSMNTMDHMFQNILVNL